MNDFYKQPKILQWIEAILLVLFGFLPALAIIENGYSNPIYYLLFIIYVPVGQFAFTPIFKLIGVYKYYSPMLLGYMANDHQIDLHRGGGFSPPLVLSPAEQDPSRFFFPHCCDVRLFYPNFKALE